MLRPIRRALLSVSDKTGLVEFARELHAKYGVELIATGGTKKALSDAGLPVKDVSELTGFPEILDGRVKTLHPTIYAGLLAKRDKPEHMQTLAEHHLPEIDLVVCNLYPFEQTVAKPGVTEAEVIENIDIGGPCMVRAAAKNFEAVAVLTNPEQYDPVLRDLDTNQGALPRSTRLILAEHAFNTTNEYDSAIFAYFMRLVRPERRKQVPGEPWTYSELIAKQVKEGSEWPSILILDAQPKQRLRYGENPHQHAAFYVETTNSPCVATAEQLHGKELSYNNILDLDSALNLVREFSGPAAAVVKHNNPCGAACASTLVDAFTGAWEGDPLSAFGGILAFNRPVDSATAEALATGQRFVECIIAPDFEPKAFTIITTKPTWKKNVRLLKTGPLIGQPQGLDYRRVDGGLLVQTRDVGADNPDQWKVVTKKKPSEEEFHALWFAWLVCKHVKSNAIVLAKGMQAVGVGAGQMSRVDSVQIAIRKAHERARGAVLASDAFFPFRDSVDAAAAAGATAIVQPGGSQRDAESIAACDEHGVAMVFTGVRHFRH